MYKAKHDREDEMRLADFINAFEPYQKVCIYSLGDGFSCYEGPASGVPADMLAGATVEGTHVYEWTIDVLVRMNNQK